MKISRIIPALIAGLLLFGCSDNSTKPGTKEPLDAISGVYFLYGTQVSLKYCYIGTICEEGEILSTDTIQTSFTISAELIEDKTDTLRFSGLQGADENPRFLSDGFNGGPAAYPCNDHSRLCAYARLNGHELMFDLLSPAGAYYGSGTLSDGILNVETYYRYRGSGVDYHLEGVKIEDEE